MTGREQQPRTERCTGSAASSSRPANRCSSGGSTNSRTSLQAGTPAAGSQVGLKQQLPICRICCYRRLAFTQSSDFQTLFFRKRELLSTLLPNNCFLEFDDEHILLNAESSFVR